MSHPLRDQPDRLSYSGEDAVKCPIWYGCLAFLRITPVHTGTGDRGKVWFIWESSGQAEVGSWDWSQTEVVWFIVFSASLHQHRSAL